MAALGENELIAPRRKSELAGANSTSLLLAPQPPSPFPSPSSSFVPPPAQEPHEFANKTNVRMAAAKQTRSASHSRRGSEDSRGRLPSEQASSPIPLEPPALAPSTPTPSSLSPAPINTSPKRFSADSAQSSLSSSRPAPASPALSRHSSLLHTGSRKRLSTLSIVSTPPAAPRRSLLVKIRDFAFPSGDERHVGGGPLAKRASVASSAGSGRGGWLGRVFGRKRNGEVDGEAESEYHDANSESQDDYDDRSGSEEDLDDEGEGDGDAPFVPGLYRALYPFEPEGTAEMALAEDQQVRVLGRGGGVGWVVVLKPDGIEQALVPEGYLELVRPDADEDDDEESVGGGTEAPQTPRALS